MASWRCPGNAASPLSKYGGGRHGSHVLCSRADAVCPNRKEGNTIAARALHFAHTHAREHAEGHRDRERGVGGGGGDRRWGGGDRRVVLTPDLLTEVISSERACTLRVRDRGHCIRARPRERASERERDERESVPS